MSYLEEKGTVFHEEGFTEFAFPSGSACGSRCRFRAPSSRVCPGDDRRVTGDFKGPEWGVIVKVVTEVTSPALIGSKKE